MKKSNTNKVVKSVGEKPVPVDDAQTRLDDSEDVDINDGKIDRVVPLSSAELMGVSYQKNDKSIIVEFGYIKNRNREEVIIDTRKKLPYPMALDLYKKLKKYFENESI